MKIIRFPNRFAVMVVAGLALSAATLSAQSAANTSTTTTQVASNPAVPPLSDPASQVLRLAQAKVSDDTIIAFVKNSGDRYALNADQIIYLRQQGVSDAVLNLMLSRPQSAVIPAPSASAPSSSASYDATGSVTTDSGSTATVAPTVTYVQTAPVTTYYSQPYYYPDYAWYPPVVFSFGWVGGFHGGGFHGGGWHR